jgi:acyl-coenzyme A thioesterase 13
VRPDADDDVSRGRCRWGAKCRVEVELVATGRTMAHVTGVIRDMEGRVCVSCVHEKVVFHGPKL